MLAHFRVAHMNDENRTDRRFRTELPVFVSTVLDGQEAWIIDVSERGLRLRGFSAPPRARVIVQLEGDTVSGTIRWAKPDNTIGIRLDTPLKEGPLAAIWSRFRDNVNAFRAPKPRAAQPTFGKKQA